MVEGTGGGTASLRASSAFLFDAVLAVDASPATNAALDTSGRGGGGWSLSVVLRVPEGNSPK